MILIWWYRLLRLNLQGITWIKVSPMLEDNDILALQKIFLNLRKQKWKHKNNSMTEPVAEAGGCICSGTAEYFHGCCMQGLAECY